MEVSHDKNPTPDFPKYVNLPEIYISFAALNEQTLVSKHKKILVMLGAQLTTPYGASWGHTRLASSAVVLEVAVIYSVQIKSDLKYMGKCVPWLLACAISARTFQQLPFGKEVQSVRPYMGLPRMGTSLSFEAGQEGQVS
jgi:hypothetical protein